MLNNFVANNCSSALIKRLRSYLLLDNIISPLFPLQAIRRSMQTRWLVHTVKSWTTKTRSTSQTTSRYHTVPKNLYVVSSRIGSINFPVESTKFNSFICSRDLWTCRSEEVILNFFLLKVLLMPFWLHYIVTNHNESKRKLSHSSDCHDFVFLFLRQFLTELNGWVEMV